MEHKFNHEGWYMKNISALVLLFTVAAHGNLSAIFDYQGGSSGREVKQERLLLIFGEDMLE